MALSVLGVVTLGVTSTMRTVEKSVGQVELIREQDFLFSIGVQNIRSKEIVSRGLRLNGVGSLNTSLIDCLKENGSNCQSQVVDWQNFEAGPEGGLNASFFKRGICASGSPQCELIREVRYRFICEQANSCSAIIFKVAVTGVNRGARLVAKQGVFKTTGRHLLGVDEIAFRCQGRPLKGIDYAGLSDICTDGMPEAGCESSLNSLAGGDRCQKNVTRSCSTGFSSVGLHTSSGGVNCHTRQVAQVTPPGGGASTNPGPPASGSKESECKSHIGSNQTCSGGILAATYFPDGDTNKCLDFCSKVKGTQCCSMPSNKYLSGVFCHATGGSPIMFNNNFGGYSPHGSGTTRAVECTANNQPTQGAPSAGYWQGESMGCDFKQNGLPVDAYLRANPDVASVCQNEPDVNACVLHHYNTYAHKEGRSMSPSYAKFKSTFDQNKIEYLAYNPDVVLAGVDPWFHFQTCGNFESRQKMPYVSDWNR